MIYKVQFNVSTYEIRQERSSRFYLRVEWTSAFKGFTGYKFIPQKSPIVQFDTKPEHARAIRLKNGHFMPRKTLALTVFHVYFHHALRSVLHVKGMENHLISNLMKLCDSTNRVTRCWTLVISVVLSACYLNLCRLLIGVFFQVQMITAVMKKLKSDRLSGSF